MASFKDKSGKDWMVDFNIGICRKIKSASGLDFANAHDGKAVSAIQAEDDKMVQVIWLLCEQQAKERGITDEEQILVLLDGNVLEDAQRVIEESLLSFTRPERRAALEAIFQKKKEAMDKAMLAAVAKVNAVNIDEALSDQMSRLTPGT